MDMAGQGGMMRVRERCMSGEEETTVLKERLEKWGFTPHYAWKILLVACMINGGVGGIIINCFGQFYQPIAQEFGVAVSAATIATTFMGVTSFLLTPFVVRLFNRYPIRIVVAVTLIIYTGANGLIGTVDQLWQYYALTVLKGTCNGFLVYSVVTLVLKAWFHEHLGMALSISAVFAGVLGIAMNMAIGVMIENWGWRAAVMVSSAVAMALSVPGVCVFLRRNPEEVGTKPLGYKPPVVQSEQVEEKRNNSPITFFFGITIIVLCMLQMGYQHQLSNLAVSMGYSRVIGAALVSTCLAGNLCCKMIVGALSEWVGIRRAVWFNFATMFVAQVLLAVAETLPLLYIGAFLLGSSNVVSTVIAPLLVGEAYHGKQYVEVYSRYSVIMCLPSPISTGLLGFIYAGCGSYRPAFWGSAVIMVVCTLMVWKYLKVADSLKQ